MRAQQVQGLEGPSGLHLVEVDEPEDAGSRRHRSRGRRRELSRPPAHPRRISDEAAAAVRARGRGRGSRPFRASRVPDSSEGDRVMAFTMLGGFADVALAEPALTLAIPNGLTIEAASGFVMNYHTAHFALARRGRDPAWRSRRDPRRGRRDRHRGDTGRSRARGGGDRHRRGPRQDAHRRASGRAPSPRRRGRLGRGAACSERRARGRRDPRPRRR